MLSNKSNQTYCLIYEEFEDNIHVHRPLQLYYTIDQNVVEL